LTLDGPKSSNSARDGSDLNNLSRPLAARSGSFSDYDVIVHSITERLLTLPEDTVVKTGHGKDTTIAAERENILAVGGFA